jgi:penicillin-binding protein 1A
VPYDQIPPQVVHAFMAAEDKNFFQHGGIDVRRSGRAMFKNVFNFVAGRRLERRLDHHPAGRQERSADQ